MAAQTTIDVFDTAFLPRAVRVTEKGFERERGIEFIVMSELNAIVLGEGSAQLLRQGLEPETEVCRDTACCSVLLFDDVDKARGSFLGDDE